MTELKRAINEIIKMREINKSLNYRLKNEVDQLKGSLFSHVKPLVKENKALRSQLTQKDRQIENLKKSVTKMAYLVAECKNKQKGII